MKYTQNRHDCEIVFPFFSPPEKLFRCCICFALICFQIEKIPLTFITLLTALLFSICDEIRPLAVDYRVKFSITVQWCRKFCTNSHNDYTLPITMVRFPLLCSGCGFQFANYDFKKLRTMWHFRARALDPRPPKSAGRKSKILAPLLRAFLTVFDSQKNQIKTLFLSAEFTLF